MPHVQLPAVQPSDSPGSHATHVAPSMPQVAFAGIVHVVPWQQPVGHDAASHTHWPPRHS